MIKWDKPCYKCLSHFCDLSCEEPKHLQVPQRTWVGLTDDEFEAVWLKHYDEYGFLRDENQDGWAYEKELLAIYKEKNSA